MRELTNSEIDRVGGGLAAPTSTLGSDVVKFFTDAANGAPQSTLITDGKAVLSDLLGGTPRQRQ